MVEERGHGAVLQLDRPTLTRQWATRTNACRGVARAVQHASGRGEGRQRSGTFEIGEEFNDATTF